MNRRDKQWQIYERFIARLMTDQLSTEFCVTANARVKGIVSGRKRQIDVLIDLRHDTDNSQRMIVDAKNRQRKIDITNVEAFKGLMEDVGAVHGYLVCTSGHTIAAKKRAEDFITISLVPIEALEEFNPLSWPTCKNPQCKQGRILWDGFPEFFVGLWRFLHFVGKCDRCGWFHVHCVSDGGLYGLSDEDEVKCGCLLPWFWLSSIEPDEFGHRSAELHSILPTGIITVDRRSI